MWSLEAELAKYAKSKAFKAAAAQAVKDGKVSGAADKKEAEKTAKRFKEILEEEIASVEANDPSLRNPLVGSDAISLSSPELVEIDGTSYYKIIVSLDGPSVRKESISPNQEGLDNVLLLYDTGYSHPIMGRLPYKFVGEEKVIARRNIPATGFIGKAIDRFNLESAGVATAERI